jgi:predicted nucleic acid-binding protein
MNAIDTNVWIYSHDTRDANKQAVAQGLIANLRSLALPWQIGCEFIAACRKLVPLGFDDAHAWTALADMQSIANAVLMPVPRLWTAAKDLQARHLLSFWDALLVAACIDGGVTVLYTEDMGSPRQLDALSLVNPFVPPPVP